MDLSIRIFLIDEHGPARDILARRLESIHGLSVVGFTSDSEAAIREIVTLSPDLALIDTKMKQSDAMGVCRRVLGADEQIKVAVLTSHRGPDERRQACEAGVEGYLLKIVNPHSLSDWIGLAVGRKPT